MDLTALRAFRVALYQTFHRGQAVLMNILDALLVTPHAQRVVEVTLSPAFARAWPSLYQGLQQGRIDRQALRRLYCASLPYTPGDRLVLAVDPTSILRPASPTARDRMAVHAANLPEDAKPVGMGWQFSAIVVTPVQPSSWTYYLACTRIRSGTTPTQLAVVQLATLRPQLPARPLVLGDRHFGSAAFLLHPGMPDCDRLARIQTHRLFYRLPPERAPDQRGRPRKRGAKFQPKDPRTHGPPTHRVTTHDARGRAVAVTAWDGLYFGQDMTHPLTLVRCVRDEGAHSTRDPREIWVVWDSPASPDHPAEPAPVTEVPALYARRFSIDHGFRFDKQSLLWEDPRLRTPGQFQLWTDVLIAAHNTLVLTRPLVEGIRLPWERGQERAETPQQVRRAFAGLYPELGTPAPAPQLRGKSPGRAPGTCPPPAKRYPIVRKTRAHAPPAASQAA
jgi:hypothetical protein